MSHISESFISVSSISPEFGAVAVNTRRLPCFTHADTECLDIWQSMSAQQTPQAETKKKVEKLAGLMEKVIAKKDANTRTALENRVNVFEGVLIGGDAFTMGYLAFAGVQVVAPSLAAIPAISIAMLFCAETAGLINCGVALVSLKEGLQALENGDKKLALRLLIDSFTLLAIGIIMIIAGLAKKMAALGAVGTLFASNPWLLPVLFFIITIPVMIEIGSRIKDILTRKDLGAQLFSGELTKLIHDPTKGIFCLGLLLDLPERDALKKLSEKLEALQANLGVKGAIETFNLLLLLLREQNVEQQRKKVEKEIEEWNLAQYVRMFQQILYLVAFVISMGMLAPGVNAIALSAIQSFSMAGANGIPLYMDCFWPFKRNTPLVVPKVEV
jgi:hypothetical protein